MISTRKWLQYNYLDSDFSPNTHMYKLEDPRIQRACRSAQWENNTRNLHCINRGRCVQYEKLFLRETGKNSY